MHQAKLNILIKFSSSPILVKGLLFGLALQIGISSAALAFEDPLNTPARNVEGLTSRPIQSISGNNEMLVAAGSRGLLIYSNDNGENWSQSTSTVQSDLVSTHFSSEKKGWAVGHDGVVLHTEDGGLSWEKQLDGRMASESFKKHYQDLKNIDEKIDYDQYINMVEMNFGSGPNLPFLDVWFDDEYSGFVVGSFGMIAATQDGGKTWVPWFDRIDNEENIHLNAIKRVGGDIYIAAERGTVFRLDRKHRKFTAINTEYEGSFFGLTGSEDGVIVFGLEGTAYRSSDLGSSWKKLSVATGATITYGSMINGGPYFYLTSATGDILYGNVADENVVLLDNKNGIRMTGLKIIDDAMVISSLEGILIISRKDVESMILKSNTKK